MKRFLIETGRAFPYLFALLYYHIFFLAFTNPTKLVVVNINMFGEAFIEAIVLIILAPIIIYSLFRKGDK